MDTTVRNKSPPITGEWDKVEPTTRLLSVQQVAARLGVSQVTVRRLYRAGKIPASRVGRLIRIAEPAVDTYLSESRVSAVS
jgi:excisionase family DNA binding protein